MIYLICLGLDLAYLLVIVIVVMIYATEILFIVSLLWDSIARIMSGYESQLVHSI